MKRFRIPVFAVVLAVLVSGAGAVLNQAAASYQVTTGDPVATFNPEDFERQVATFCKNNGITTDAAYQAAVNGITAGSALELAAVKAMLRSVKLQP